MASSISAKLRLRLALALVVLENQPPGVQLQEYIATLQAQVGSRRKDVLRAKEVATSTAPLASRPVAATRALPGEAPSYSPAPTETFSRQPPPVLPPPAATLPRRGSDPTSVILSQNAILSQLRALDSAVRELFSTESSSPEEQRPSVALRVEAVLQQCVAGWTEVEGAEVQGRSRIHAALISLGSTLLSSLVSTSPTSQQLHLHLLTTHFTEPPLFRALSLVAITHFKAVCDSAPDEAGRSTLLQLLTFLEQSAELGVEVREGLTRIVGSFVGVEAVGEEVEERVLLWLEKGWEREERGE